MRVELTGHGHPSPFQNGTFIAHLAQISCIGKNVKKDWKAKLESSYSFMLKYSKITVCGTKFMFSLFSLKNVPCSITSQSREECFVHQVENWSSSWYLVKLGRKKYLFHERNSTMSFLEPGPISKTCAGKVRAGRKKRNLEFKFVLNLQIDLLYMFI